MKEIIKKVAKYWVLKIKYPLFYKINTLKPIDDKKVVFIENRFSNITNSFSLLYKSLTEEYECNVKVCFLREVDGTWKGYDKRCMKMIKEVSNAACIFVNDSSNVVGCIPFRKETKIIQVWHACGAFKKWGFSNAKGTFGADLKRLLKYPYYAKYSLVTVSSEEVAWAYSEAFNIPEPNEIVRATGVSRTDIFFQEKYKQKAYEKLYEVVPNAKGKKVVMYAPTFRGNASAAIAPSNLNQEVFCERFGEEYVLLCKHHPLVKRKPLIRKGCENVVFDVSDTMSIEDLMVVSDICITDYSSVVFEYSLFERPVLIYAYDISQYTDWRGFYYNFEEFIPGKVIHNNRELMDSIENIDQYDITQVIEFKNKYMNACDGNATNRIIKEVFGEKLKKKFSAN